jgi:hypothetical protein
MAEMNRNRPSKTVHSAGGRPIGIIPMEIWRQPKRLDLSVQHLSHVSADRARFPKFSAG